ncbi:hypothetical protein D4R71_00350 [bacterium]|nr:MAG: hypothetical protein D4R71_00350 [bacterium]
MTDPNVASTTNPNIVEDPSLIKEAGTKDTLLSQAGAQTEEQKQAQAAEETRLLDADVTTLSEEDKGKRTVIEKTREDKRLLNTPDDQLSEEDKPKKAELVKAQDAKAKLKVVPEKYEFIVPEGMTLNQPLVDKFSPVFKELEITQEGAQKLVDLYSAEKKAEADAQATNFKQFLKESYDETVKELGATYKDQLAYVAKVRDRFLSEETQEMLDASGLSNNKAFILDLIKLGKLISEDKLPAGQSAAAGGAKSTADILYPEQEKK